MKRKFPKNTLNAINKYNQLLGAGVDIDENEVYSKLAETLEMDFGKIDTSNLTWWDKLVIELEAIKLKISVWVEVWVLNK